MSHHSGFPPNPTSGYTVEQALELMAKLPLEGLNETLVVQVVRTTLESAGVSIPQLLDAASHRQDEITDTIVRIQGEIASLNQAIEEKTAQVQAMQNQLAEIGSLRERLEG